MWRSMVVRTDYDLLEKSFAELQATLWLWHFVVPERTCSHAAAGPPQFPWSSNAVLA
jgi:hypothetical protein